MTFVLVGKWRVKQGEESGVLENIRRAASANRAEPGFRMFLPCQDRTDPRLIHFFEIYEDEAAYLAHRETDHFKRLVLDACFPRLESREITTYDVVEI